LFLKQIYEDRLTLKRESEAKKKRSTKDVRKSENKVGHERRRLDLAKIKISVDFTEIGEKQREEMKDE